MNKIIKKFKISGYETSTVITPRGNYDSKEIKDVQMSIDFGEMKSTKTKKRNKV
ncbi:hypothetical protein MKY27_01030 [Solibacillus sp. FSL R5-0449]|uniref:hypothetical protein n=1 Tax=Solibacillus sp. FSL R5-0449 TaxID=2921639 RepID=UPI0030CF6C91